MTVTPYGAHVAGQAGGLVVMTTAWGRDGATEPVDASTVRSRCAEAGPNPIGLSTGCEPVLEREITGGVEQWQHRVDGVKQTWVLDQKPEGQGPVVIELEAQGGILSVEPQSFTVRSQSGDQSGDSWRIDRLMAWDVTGRALRSWFERDGDVVRVMVEDTDAHWPVTVDPVITPANQVITSPGATDFGIGVAMGRFNADGYADMLVGARFGVNLFGQAFSYHGSAAGMDATIRWSRTGPTSYGKFGEYVVTGDINGDGRDDAVVCEFYD